MNNNTKDIKKIKDIVPLILDGEFNDEGEWITSEESKEKLYSMFDVEDEDDLDDQLVELVKNYKEVFSVYGITLSPIVGAEVVLYKGAEVFFEDPGLYL